MGSGPMTPSPPPGPGRLWDKYDLAAFFGVPVGTIAKKITARDCPPIIWVGRHARFDPVDVMAYAEQQKEKTVDLAPAVPLVAVPRSKRRVA